MSTVPSSSSHKVFLLFGERVLHVLLGGLVLLGGAGLSLLLGTMVLFTPPPRTSPLALGWLGLGAVLLALAALWGALLVRRGLRGFRLISEQGLRRDRALRDPSSIQGFAFLMGCAALLFLLTDGLRGLPAPAWYICVGCFWLLPVVAVHELGHAAVASWVGIPWISLRIGPLEVLRSGSGKRVRWHWAGLNDALGFARFEPAVALQSPIRFAWVALGGPVANALAGLVQGALAHALGRLPLEVQGASDFVWAGALVHGSFALANLLPQQRARGPLSDGALWLWLWRLRRQSAGRRLLVQVQAESTTRRPREWRPTVEALLGASSAPGEEPEVAVTLLLYALAILLDRDDVAAARALLEDRAVDLSSSSAALRRELLLQHALVHALCGPDATRARACLEEAAAERPRVAHPFYPRLAEAAVLLAEGQDAEARTALTQWEEESLASGSREELIIGNLWALERLRVALGIPSPEALATAIQSV